MVANRGFSGVFCATGSLLAVWQYIEKPLHRRHGPGEYLPRRTGGRGYDAQLGLISMRLASFNMDENVPVANKAAHSEAARSEFVQLLTKAQLGLLRYITALVGNPDEANNILQETNLLLWEKFDEFKFGTNFDAWATRVAYWQVRAYSRDCRRERLVFSEDIVTQLAEHSADAADMDSTVAALRKCLKELRDSDFDLIRLRYDDGFSVQKLSGHLGKSPSAIKGALLRARRMLRGCIERRLAREG